MRSARAAPPCVNISSNDINRAPSISFSASPWVPMVVAMLSAEPRKVSITSSLRDRMVSVMAEPVCSSFCTTSPPRRLRSTTSDSPVARRGRIHFLASHHDVFGGLCRNLRQRVRGLRRYLCQAFGGLGRGLQQSGRDLVRTLAHHFGDGGGALREIVGHIGESQLHHLDEILRQDVELFGDGFGLEREAGIEPLGRAVDRARGRETRILDRGRRGQADGVDRLRGLLCGLLQTLEDFASPLAELRQHLVADAIERGGDVIGLFLQVAGDAIGRGGDLGGDLVTDAGDVLVQVEMHAGDGVAHLLGLPDQAVALGAEIVEQVANTDFVVVIGALEGCDLALHQGFQFRRARQRTLDAVAHGRHLAANGLADGDDGFAGEPFRLGEAQGDLRHGLRQRAHFARALDHMRDGEEESDRSEKCEDKREQRRREALLQLRQVRRGEDDGENGPDHRQDAGRNEQRL
jgi:hypothetical protein